MATEGFDARLRLLQDDDGQPCTATGWSLNLPRGLGTDAGPLGDTIEKLAVNSHGDCDPNVSFWAGEVDTCINGVNFANEAWLGAGSPGIARCTRRAPDGRRRAEPGVGERLDTVILPFDAQ